ncbi:MAG: hypothetical protein LBJ11_03435 [Oscillospiraceae bacterium]|jgi:RHS repeat-associated protein|nr:hypothetical protein [Oscillospiraceae bacterium]
MQDTNGNTNEISYHYMYDEIDVHDGILECYSWFGANFIDTITDGAGRTIRFLYDFQETEIYDGEPFYDEEWGYVTELYVYTKPRLRGIQEPSGREITFGYPPSPSHFPDSITYPDGRQTAFTYSLMGNITDGTNSSMNKLNSQRIDRIAAADGTDVLVTYCSSQIGNPNSMRVQQIERRGKLREDGTRETFQKLVFTYGGVGEWTRVEDLVQIKPTYQVYLFDFAGRLVNVRNQDNIVQYTDYNSDGYKNNTVSYLSSAQPMNENLARNHSFEQSGSGIPKWSASISGGGGGGSVNVTTDQRYFGQTSLRLSSNHNAASISAMQDIVISAAEKQKNYTLSAYLRLPASLTGTGGAKLTLTATNGSGGSVTASCEPTRLAMDWTRVDAAIPIPGIWSGNITLRVTLTLENAAGSVYFDAVQLEEGDSSNDYNFLENGLFREKSGAWPDRWTVQGMTGPDRTEYYGDDPENMGNFVLAAGQSGIRKTVAQTVRVDAQAGQTLIFNAKAASYAASNPDSLFGILLESDNGQSAYAPFSSRVHSAYQTTGGTLTLSGACQNVTVSLIYDNQINCAGLKGAALYLGERGTDFAYNNSGKPTQIQNGRGDKVVAAYQNGQVSSISLLHDNVTQQDYDYARDDANNVISAIDTVNGITTQYYYGSGQNGPDTYGVVTKTVTTGENGSTTSEEMTSASDWNYLDEYTDARGSVSTFQYEISSGQLLSATDPAGNMIQYSYDAVSGAMTAATGHADPQTPVSTAFSYADGVLETITHNGVTASFSYDDLWRITEAKDGNTTLVQNEYDDQRRLAKQTYGNGDWYEPAYDSDNRIIGESYGQGSGSAAPSYTYAYNRKNLLTAQMDYENNLAWRYDYDVAGRLTNIRGSDSTTAKMSYDNATNAINHLTVGQNGGTISEAGYSYHQNGAPAGANFPLLPGANGAQLSYAYDDFWRMTGTTANMLIADTAGERNYKLETNITYASGQNGNATGLVSQYTTRGTLIDNGLIYLNSNSTYSYDENGRMATRFDQMLGGSAPANDYTYQYDGLGRLVDDGYESFEFDASGNIYMDGWEYEYNDLVHPDRLTSIYGGAVSYDSMGNITEVGDYYNYTWDKGRQLTSVSYNYGGTPIAEYTYNADGMPVTKTRNGKLAAKYTWVGDLLARLVYYYNGSPSVILDFTYDSAGKPFSMTYNGKVYYYVYNGTGDVVALFEGKNLHPASYTYDAYGYCYEDAGFSSNNVVNLNPFRYRGYFYDSDTFMYFLKTRWYDPTLRRFLSPDSLFVAGNELTGVNLYAYCNGDPVNYSDPDGTKTIKAKDQSVLWNADSLNSKIDIEWIAKVSTWMLANSLGLSLSASQNVALSKMGKTDGVTTGTASFNANGYAWSFNFAVGTISAMSTYVTNRLDERKFRDQIMDDILYSSARNAQNRIDNGKGKPFIGDVIISTVAGLVGLGPLIADNSSTANSLVDKTRNINNGSYYLFVVLGNFKGKKIK